MLCVAAWPGSSRPGGTISALTQTKCKFICTIKKTADRCTVQSMAQHNVAEAVVLVVACHYCEHHRDIATVQVVGGLAASPAHNLEHSREYERVGKCMALNVEIKGSPAVHRFVR